MIAVHRNRSHQLSVGLLCGRGKSGVNVLSVATADQRSIPDVIAAPYEYCLDLAGSWKERLCRRSTTYP